VLNKFFFKLKTVLKDLAIGIRTGFMILKREPVNRHMKK